MQVPDTVLALRVRTMQIVAGAILFGLVTFCTIAVVIVAQGGGAARAGRDPDVPPIVTIVAWAMFAMCFVARFLVVGPILRSAVQRIAATQPHTSGDMAGEPVGSDEAALLAARQTALIVSCALLEGPALAAAIAYLIEAQASALLIVLAAVIAMLLQFPTRERVRAWLEHHLALVAELRQLGASFDVS